jgi:hypothetical protein
VAVIRLVPLGGAEQASGQSAIVASFGSASLRTEGNCIFPVGRHESTLGRVKVGDIVQWVAEPSGSSGSRSENPQTPCRTDGASGREGSRPDALARFTTLTSSAGGCGSST